MPTCNDCGAFVTARFARVLGDNEDEVYPCRRCTGFSELIEGRFT